MKKKTNKKQQEHKPSIEFFLACQDKSTLRAAGCSLSDLIAAGCSASTLIAAGYSLSDLSEWDSIPALDKAYTRLLDDINNKKREHNQGTYGPLNDFDPSANICGTPMCTAGHLVNMAGKVGYKLMKKYGWNEAAALIHLKSHPNDPIQNFGSIPQRFAMAYIEEMARRESNDKVRQRTGVR